MRSWNSISEESIRLFKDSRNEILTRRGLRGYLKIEIVIPTIETSLPRWREGGICAEARRGMEDQDAEIPFPPVIMWRLSLHSNYGALCNIKASYEFSLVKV